MEERLEQIEQIKSSGKIDYNIKSIHAFKNGFVMVFDQNGQQMTYYQGSKDHVWEMLKAIAPPDCEWNENQEWK